MGFAGKYDLYWLQRVREQAFQAPKSVKNQIRPLVSREPSRKADRENPGIEQCPKRNYTLGANALRFPFLAGALADVRKQQDLQTPPQPPEFLIRDVVNCLPG